MLNKVFNFHFHCVPADQSWCAPIWLQLVSYHYFIFSLIPKDGAAKIISRHVPFFYILLVLSRNYLHPSILYNEVEFWCAYIELT